MLASPLRALELPTFRPYTASVPTRSMEQQQQPQLAQYQQLCVKNGPLNFSLQAHRNMIELILDNFGISQSHTELFAMFGSMPWLRSLYVKPVAGMFPEMDVLNPTVSPTLKPPRIPHRRCRRIALRSLKYFVVTAKASFCSAIMNQCQIPLGCAVEVNCTDCAVGPASGPIEDLLPRLRERIEATARRREGGDDDGDEDELLATEQTLEIHRHEISIANDTRGTPFICDAVTKLTIQHESGIDHSYFLPPLLEVFGYPAKPRVLSLSARDVIAQPGRYRNDLLRWLANIDDSLNEIKFHGDHAFQSFAPLLMAVSTEGTLICGQLFELSFRHCEFGAQTPNQATLAALLVMREGRVDLMGTNAPVERLLFDDCPGLRIEDFPEHLEVIVEDIDKEGDDGGMIDDDDMQYDNNDEDDGNDSDVTIQHVDHGSKEDEDDGMDWDES